MPSWISRVFNGTENRADQLLFYTHIGLFTVAWARAEMALDACVEAIYIGYGSNSVQPELPRNLNNRIKFFRRAHRQILSLRSESAKAVAIADTFSRMKGDRHDLIHGVVKNNLDDSKRHLLKLDRGANQYVPRQRPVSLADVNQLIEKTVDLESEVWSHFKWLLSQIRADDLD